MSENKIDRVLGYAIWKAVRRVHAQYDPVRKQVLKDAMIVQYQTKQDGTLGKKYLSFYKCASCEGLFKKSEVDVDHTKPVGAYPRYPTDFKNGYFLVWFWQLFCGKDNYKILCKPCHKEKSKRERAK